MRAKPIQKPETHQFIAEAMAIDRAVPPMYYRPLESNREIRLLHLYPADRSDNIYCTLQVKSLDHVPPFDALSYTWGDPEERQDIFCNQKRLSITQNLATALRSLQYADSTLLWVDAICINQSDSNEKNIQVPLMCEIYSQARKVVAWVGPDKPEDRRVMAIQQYLQPTDEQLTLEEMRTWFSLANFLKRPWFGRIWIVQEAAVAKDLVIRCGQKVLPWETLRRGLWAYIRRLGFFLTTSGMDLSLEKAFTLLSVRNLVTEHSPVQQNVQAGRFEQFRFGDIDGFRNSKHVQVGDFLNFVKGTRSFGSTDPRDRIFALRGLVLEGERHIVEVDYSQSYCILFEKFARAIIMQYRTLDVLSNAGLHPSLPSWVPDWTAPMRTHPLNISAYAASGDATRKKPLPQRPQHSTVVIQSLQRDGQEVDMRTITLRGILLDEIETLTVGYCVAEDTEPDFEQRFLQSFKVVNKVFKPFQSQQLTPNSIATVRITPELEAQWEKAAHTCLPGYGSIGSTGKEDPYIQCLIGALPFEQLASNHGPLLYNGFQIWRERLSKNPTIAVFGVIAREWTKVPIDPELLAMYYMYHESWSSKELKQKKMKGPVIGGRVMEVPFYQTFQLAKQIAKKGSGKEPTPPSPMTIERATKEALKKSKINEDGPSAKMYIARMFSRSVERMARNRQFCTTRGRRIGWVPLAADRGDLVCIFQGASVPYILRRSKEENEREEYRLVGEAYIHGLMQGEGWNTGRGLNLQDINLI